MKIMYFDFENGVKTIGSESYLQEKFGFPVFNPDGWESFQDILGQIFKPVSVTKEIQIAKGITIKQNKREVIKRDGVDVDLMVVDTFTELVKKYQRSLSVGGKMSFNKWGEVKSEVDLLLEYLNGFPISIICNVHTKPEKDDDSGIVEVLPAIEGTSRYDVSKWFDFVMYSDTRRNEDGSTEFVWVFGRNERYTQCKDRSQLLDKVIPQDYKILLNAAKEKGWESIKVLNIGKPGTGKTLSVDTLL
jgi:hypothetical protein